MVNAPSDVRKFLNKRAKLLWWKEKQNDEMEKGDIRTFLWKKFDKEWTQEKKNRHRCVLSNVLPFVCNPWAYRRRMRLLRSSWRHEQLSLLMQAATVGHHSWYRVSTVGSQTPAQQPSVDVSVPQKFPRDRRDGEVGLTRTSATTDRRARASKFPSDRRGGEVCATRTSATADNTSPCDRTCDVLGE